MIAVAADCLQSLNSGHCNTRCWARLREKVRRGLRRCPCTRYSGKTGLLRWQCSLFSGPGGDGGGDGDAVGDAGDSGDDLVIMALTGHSRTSRSPALVTLSNKIKLTIMFFLDNSNCDNKKSKLFW